MPSREFQPGFRISILDAIILVAGTAGAVLGWQVIWWIGFAIAFVVAHFFLFCNVFRVARVPELAWAATFVALSSGTILNDVPGWIGTVLASLAMTIAIVMNEIRRPSYHGIAWRRWNPDLPQWWKSHFDQSITSQP
jgi:hypothetical protein